MPSDPHLANRSGIRDNHQRGTIGDFLKQRIKQGSILSIVSAYFTIYAFEALREELSEIDSLQFLFGEPRFIRALDPSKTDRKSFQIEDGELRLQNRLQQKAVAKACAQWIREKVEIRSVQRTNLLHGKMYHIANHGIEEAILGSSNFTMRGLGFAGDGRNNIELNLEVDSNRDRRDLKAWFDEIWADTELVEDVKEQVLLYLAQLYQNNAPEFIYYKTLFHIFERFLDEQQQDGLLYGQSQVVDTAIWNSLFSFQKDGVKGAINKIQRHNGCIIADSVGLGKTFEALAIIKYFELRNGKVLVLCPKKLRENWTVYQAQNNSALNPFVNDRFAYTVLSHTDLSREQGFAGDIDLGAISWGNYDLVVIDESHNFRNNTPGRKDADGQVVRKSRYGRLMEDILQSGIKTKVLLLSATPVNNDLKDLRNQLAFITEGRDDAFAEELGIASVSSTLATAQRTFTAWSQADEHTTSQLLQALSSAFFTLLDELTIARSRKHIQRYYSDALEQLGGFPERQKPVSIFAQIDLKDRFMSYDKLNQEISGYHLTLFNPSHYLLGAFRDQYPLTAGNFTQGQRESYLIGMMKVNFLKRLESSVHSFATTLDRTIIKIDDLIRRIDRFKQLQAADPMIDLVDLAPDDLDDEEVQAALQVGQKFPYRMAHLDVDAWRHALQGDKDQLLAVYNAASLIDVTRDAKLAELKALIQKKVNEPTTNKRGEANRKVLVFTAFADTATYLYGALHGWATSEMDIHSALVVGSGDNRTTFGRREFSHILTNFSPRSKQRDKMTGVPQEGEIDLLIATDCISEGQNLQDCDYLVNYDIHWNPVRIIQRFGRIDRIGSVNTSVQLVNFWPTPDLNRYINLKARVEARMALVDISATFDDNLLAPADLEVLAENELKYRDRQLLRLQKEVLDLEDLDETPSLNAFTLDDFRIELSNYLASNRKQLEEAPLGLYAVVLSDPEYPQIGPGVIFCLRQVGDTSGNELVNPLQPYFLVYVRDDGEVRYGFAQPKQILEIYRVMCAGRPAPYEELCSIFDVETEHGAAMSAYDNLLEHTITSIAATFKRRAAQHLLSGRTAVLSDRRKQATATADFELITWLVIK